MSYTLREVTPSAMVVEAYERLNFVLDFLLEELCENENLEFVPEICLADKTEQILQLLDLRENDEDEDIDYARFFFWIIAEIGQLCPRCLMPVQPPELKEDLEKLANTLGELAGDPTEELCARLRPVLEFTISFTESFVGGFF